MTNDKKRNEDRTAEQQQNINGHVVTQTQKLVGKTCGRARRGSWEPYVPPGGPPRSFQKIVLLLQRQAHFGFTRLSKSDHTGLRRAPDCKLARRWPKTECRMAQDRPTTSRFGFILGKWGHLRPSRGHLVHIDHLGVILGLSDVISVLRLLKTDDA